MKIVHGISAATGLARGQAHVLPPIPEVDLNEKRARAGTDEVTRLEDAIRRAGEELEKLQQAAHGPLAEILAAQREMLDDPELKQGAQALIMDGHSAEAAITSVAASYAKQIAQLSDVYLAARSDDVCEAGRRIVAALRGLNAGIFLADPAILVARDLSPAELLGLDRTLVQAIVTENGSITGHLAIVAQNLDIPAVVGARDALLHITDRETLIVDGARGLVTIDPGKEDLQEAEKLLEKSRCEQQALSVYRDRPGLTADHVRVEVFANIGSLIEAHKAVEAGAEGIGLFRTEFIAAQGFPSEDAQYELYHEIAALLRKPLIVRTFDIGADKTVPGLDRPEEENPFLGWRGIRMSLDRPADIFLPQVRALLRAACHHDIRLMLPMVTCAQEVREARMWIEQARQALEREGYTLRDVPLGMMVETPAAALTIDQFEGLVDFLSIGTNDLTQYTYAVDRTNAQVSSRAQPLGLAMLRLISHICQTRIPVAVCGQMASDPEAIPLLVGLGVRELSVSPARVASTRQILSMLTLPQMQHQAQRAMKGEHHLELSRK